MNIAPEQKRSRWLRIAKYVIPFLAVAALILVAIGFYFGEPVFFLQWFFGLKADD